MSYDEKCWQLAHNFLSDFQTVYSENPQLASQLAQRIQSEIEAFIEEEIPVEDRP
jgi:hypothetical protein